jgi:HD superfamily phosphohydrolase
MPQWGLDTAMRQSNPWGLPERWLTPGKVITDPIHGDVYLTALEQALVDAAPFQRLRRVKQLSTTHLVYPGATHTRFAHSLGALRVVQDLFDVAWAQRDGNHAVEDLFTEWERARHVEEDGEPDSKRREQIRVRYVRMAAEAMILARLGALLHDICHVSFGHSVEDDLRILVAHDKNRVRFDRLWNDMKDDLRRRLERRGSPEVFIELDPLWSGRLLENLRPLILSKAAPGQGEDLHLPPEYPFVGDMVGNTICADLLDYLQRDHRFTGLPMSLGERFMTAFYVTPEREVLYPRRMALLLHRQGRERKDVKTELLKHLRYRYELQERVLVHHAKLAADAMVGKMLELWRDALADGAREPIPAAQVENVVKLEARTQADDSVADLDDAVRRELEDVFLEVGDDGLLERLARGDTPGCPAPDGVSELASMLLTRDLYKHAAAASGASAATRLHSRFSAPERRRGLERQAARYAGLAEDWHVVIWLPRPEMRLKLAGMLVDHGRGIAKFSEHSKQGGEIYDAHKDLWTIGVYVHPSIREQQKKAVLAKLAELMGVCWDRYETELGAAPDSWTARLAAMEALGRPTVDSRVQQLLDAVKDDRVAARGDATQTYDADRKRYEEIARRKGFLPPAVSESA